MSVLFIDNLNTPVTKDITSGTGLLIKTFNKRGSDYSFSGLIYQDSTVYFNVPSQVNYSGISATFSPNGTGTLTLYACVEDKLIFIADPTSCTWIVSANGTITSIKDDLISGKVSGLKIVTTGCSWVVNFKL